MSKNIILRRDCHIGHISAEDDHAFLSKCFVDIPQVDQLLDFDSPKSLLLGRTGSGKSAILSHIFDQNSSIQIDPLEVSLEYISNTDILSFLTKLGFDISILFEVMWKHIILIKIVRYHFENTSRFEQAIDNIFDRKNPAREYYENHKNDFWQETDITVKELTSSFSKSMSKELSAALSIPEAEVRGALKQISEVSETQRIDIENRTKSAVGKMQLQALARAIDGLNSLISNKQKSLHILIDDLDLDWASNALRYQIIFALISVIKPFRKVRNVKIICALRVDLFERIMIEKKSETLQPEKYESISTEIKWSKMELTDLFTKRVDYLFKYKYKKQTVNYKEIFPSEIRNQRFIDYIIDRTQMRPRDLIAFINVILDNAAGSSSILAKNVTNSEAEYSRKRYDALLHEWMSVHPMLHLYLDLLQSKTNRTSIKDFSGRELAVNLCLSIDEISTADQPTDIVARSCNLYSMRENTSRLLGVGKAVLSILYKVGAIELKLAKQDAYVSSYRDTAIIQPEQLSDEAVFKVSPMLWRKLGITPNL